MKEGETTGSRVEKRLAELRLELPQVPRPIANFDPFVLRDSVVYLSGQTCELGGKVLYSGRIGEPSSIDEGKRAAELCALNLLAALKLACGGNLDRVKRCIRVGGFVQAAPGYPLVPQVVDGASDLFVGLWGQQGRHARTAVGVSTLPQNALVEVDAIFEID